MGEVDAVGPHSIKTKFFALGVPLVPLCSMFFTGASSGRPDRAQRQERPRGLRSAPARPRRGPLRHLRIPERLRSTRRHGRRLRLRPSCERERSRMERSARAALEEGRWLTSRLPSARRPDELERCGRDRNSAISRRSRSHPAEEDIRMMHAISPSGFGRRARIR